MYSFVFPLEESAPDFWNNFYSSENRPIVNIKSWIVKQSDMPLGHFWIKSIWETLV